jgi:broad specificity phosphatase PhoE
VAVIYLLRHGQASFGAEDYDVLSERGGRQADVLGEELARRGVPVGPVVSGHLRRQRDTAQRALAAAGIAREAAADPRWDEYDHAELLGNHGGADPATDGALALGGRLEQALRGWVGAGAKSGCAETWPSFAERACSALADTADSLGKGTAALVFTSGGVISALCTRSLGAGDDAFLAFSRVVVNGGITKLVRGRRGTNLVSFNEHAHLERADPALVTYR